MKKTNIKILIVLFVVILIIFLINTTVVNTQNSFKINDMKQRINELESNKNELENDFFQIKMKIGLISYWSFDGNSVKDLQGNNDGVNRGAIYTHNGKFGGAYEFDGDDSFIEVKHNNNLNLGTNDFTISFWGKANYKAGSSFINKGNYFNRETGFSFSYASNPQRFYFTINDGATDVLIKTNLYNIREWTHFIGIRRGEKVEVWIDGSLYKTVPYPSMSNIDNTANLMFGKSIVNKYLDGSIDEIKIWNRALSSKEIEYLTTKR